MENELGARGEHLFYTMITRTFGRKAGPIFRPQFLGDKYPTVDFLVEIISLGTIGHHFFVQVKTTCKGMNTKHRLQVRLKQKDMQNLASYPVPTYVVGIDEPEETGYIISANRNWRKGLSSFPTTFPINPETQDILWQEVQDFWQTHQGCNNLSHFIESDWR